jgi:nucleotide-binding universal stress UspA family protein
MLDGLSYVQRYAWFALPTSAGSGTTGLFNPGPVGHGGRPRLRVRQVAAVPGRSSRSAREALGQAIAAVADLAPGVDIRPVVVEGNPARALLDAAKGADLLVVGSRGHGGFTEALLGSVGQHCVHHADCPVVVIRGARPDAD